MLNLLLCWWVLLVSIAMDQPKLVLVDTPWLSELSGLNLGVVVHQVYTHCD